MRSIGVTENGVERRGRSPGSGGSEVTPRSTSPEKKSSRAWFDDVFVMAIVNGYLPVQSAAAAWYSAGVADVSDSMLKLYCLTGGQSAEFRLNVSGTSTRVLAGGSPAGSKPFSVVS